MTCYCGGGISRMQPARGKTRKEIWIMKRYAFWLALASLSLSPLALPGTAIAANAEAKKFCSDQWDAEKKSGTIPRGMTREKYMRQCTTNYTANHSEQTPPPTRDQQQSSSAPAPAAWPPAPASTPGNN